VDAAAERLGWPTERAVGELRELLAFLGGPLSSEGGGAPDSGSEPTAAGGGVDRLLVWVDGAARGNPGPAACAAILKDATGEVLLRRGRRLGQRTNNEAEYEGVLLALELAHRLGARELQVHMDSELVARQLEGRYRVKAPHLIPLYRRVREWVARFDSVRWVHVPREENREADRIVNDVLDGREIE
jgi:ribonuclease HI